MCHRLLAAALLTWLLTACSGSGGHPQTATGGTFSCGVATCEMGTQYCDDAAYGTANEPDAFWCEPMPEPCLSDPTCTCVTNAIDATGFSCTGSDGAVTMHTDLG